MIQKDRGKRQKSYYSNRKNGLKRQDHRLDRNASKEAIRSGEFDELSGRVKVRRANERDWF